MRIKFSSSLAAIIGGIFLANIAAAHPGHNPTDLAAQVSQPLAGADHFAAFLALTSILLLALRFALKRRSAKACSAMQAQRDDLASH
ncbi:MAG TPA: HupE/UreJ family protein [Verrucomicrobiae bacterium]|jgi:hydrogenase/urease accessory protein HupE